MQISSPHNKRIRLVQELHEKRRLRLKMGLCVVEGEQEIEYALRGGYIPESLFVCEDRPISLNHLENVERYAVSLDVFEKVSYRGADSKVFAIFKIRQFELPKQHLKRVLVLEKVEKPGNLGAVFRSALAAGVDWLVTLDNSTDFYNANCIRASVGTVFLLPHRHLTHEAFWHWASNQQLTICATRLNGAENIYLSDLPERAAWIMGGEHSGLSDFWERAGVRGFYIPMEGEIDSLNLSVSSALVLYEHKRQFG